jgi:hypothetical protein
MIQGNEASRMAEKAVYADCINNKEAGQQTAIIDACQYTCLSSRIVNCLKATLGPDETMLTGPLDIGTRYTL